MNKREFIKKTVCFIAILLLALKGFSQTGYYLITGKVIDEESKAPLLLASVFAQNTTFGTASDVNGNFKLSLPAGGYSLVITFTGYQTETKRISTAGTNNISIIITLKKKEKLLQDLVISSNHEIKNGWQEYGAIFLENFIGLTDNSKSCSLKNKDVLRFYFSSKRNQLKILADEPLEIVNNALGYNIKYTLDSFVYDYNIEKTIYIGYPLFEKMQSSDSIQQKKWEANRLIAYKGSMLHFMRSLYNRQLAENGFQLSFYKKDKHEEVTTVALSDLYADLNYNKVNSSRAVKIKPNQNTLVVMYAKAKPEKTFMQATADWHTKKQVSVLSFVTMEPVSIEENGYYYDQMSIEKSGYFAWKRFAEMLPYDFKSLSAEDSIYSSFIADNSDQYDTISQHETMHVHFDKDIYMPGETIWFKAYLYNVNDVSFNSTNFYAAVYNEQGKLIQQKQYPILEGSSYGDFELPDTLQGSRLQFRAFTKTMIAEDSSNVYKRILTVYNKENNTDNIINKTISLQFFPEGGQAIAGLENEIGFKAVYSDGSPAIIKGQIIEVASHNTVNVFSTDKTGMGKIILMPEPEKNYIAVWQNEKADTITTALPKVSRYGVSFHAEIEDKALEYILARNISSDSLSILHLQAQMGNYNVYNADLAIPEEMQLAKARFSIDSLPAGLLQLTLFDKYWNPLQERLIFINKQDIAKQVTINRDTINSNPKGKNTIEFILPDTLFTNLSVSIADFNFYEQPQTHGIKQELLFSEQVENTGQNIDLLLSTGNKKIIDLITLTHPWKKYDWQKALDKKDVKYEPVDNFLSLTVNYKEKNFALPKGETLNLIISNKGKNKQFYNVLPASQTSFKQTGMIFFDSAKVDYQLNKNKDLVSYITVNKDGLLTNPSSVNPLPERISYSVTKSQATGSGSGLDSFFIPKHKKFNDVQTIASVVVKSRYKGNPELERIDELDKFYTSGMFSGNKGYQLNVIDDPMASGVNDIFDYIRFRVPGANIIRDIIGNKHFVVLRVGKRGIISIRIPVYIDEVLEDIEGGDDGFAMNLNILSVSDVAYVKYIPGIVIGGTFKSDVGAIYIYTKKGTEKGPAGKGMPSVYIKGYDLQKEFISPDYSNKDLLKEPDLRSTLYWNPNILLDKTNNKIKIEYYNNDVSKKLLLIIEGVNEKGKLIHIEKVLD